MKLELRRPNDSFLDSHLQPEPKKTSRHPLQKLHLLLIPYELPSGKLT